MGIEWLTPSFLWDKALEDDDTVRFKQPAILRFDTDTFMEDLAERLEKNPYGLKDLVACYETWTDRKSGWLPEDELDSQNTLKFYQSSHGFFYLIATNLVNTPSMMMEFSDKKVDTANEETVSFLIRRLVPAEEETSVNPKDPTTYKEYAWVVNEQEAGWQQVSLNSVLDKEERLPLFSLNFTENDKQRRLLAGLIPAANRERYQAEPKFSISTVSDEDYRVAQLDTRIVKPMIDLKEKITGNKITDKQAREVFTSILSDMADFLKKYAIDGWDAGVSGSCPGSDTAIDKLCQKLNANLLPEKKWIDFLQMEVPTITNNLSNLTIQQIKTSIDILGDIDNDNNHSLRNIIINALYSKINPRLEKFEVYIADKLVDLVEDISENTISDEQAGQIFFFIILDFAQYLNEHHEDVWTAIKDDNVEYDNDLFEELKKRTFYGTYQWDDALREVWNRRSNIISGEPKGPIIANLTKEKIENAIRNLGISTSGYRGSEFYIKISEDVKKSTQPEKEVNETPVDSTAGALYWLRCVYERPRCKNAPHPIISEPSQPFQIAPYYDPDAPRRPVQISMPVDTSIAGLKKYPKNVSFVLSKKLKEQMQKVQDKNFSDLEGEDLNEGEPPFNLGMVCSFSIPIIMICALILLMIIVQLLNIIFKWLPFFRICLPIKVK